MIGERWVKQQIHGRFRSRGSIGFRVRVEVRTSRIDMVLCTPEAKAGGHTTKHCCAAVDADSAGWHVERAAGAHVQ